MKYCKFISQVKSSQVKSSQVKSSAKIISLIALFILLFSISCKPKQNPNEHSREELVGTWKSTYGGVEYILNIDSEGNFIFNCGLHYEGRRGDGYHYNFAGKLADTFEYPYTIELTFTASSLPSVSCILTGNYFVEGSFNYSLRYLTPKSQTGKFTFHDASTLTASVIMMSINGVNGLAVWYYMWITRGEVQTLNFTKQ